MHIYNYDFLKTQISSNVAGLSNIVYDLNARTDLRKNENPKIFEALRSAAIIDSISGSNAIEGIVTTKKRMADITSEDFVPATRSETELLGYRNALSEIYNKDIEGAVSADLVKHLHKTMLLQITPDAGQFKTENNWIQERDEEGRIFIRFVPVNYKDTPDAVNQWALAYEGARHDYSISKLYLICCMIVDFLCIHPFIDGNGRVSRLLTSYLLEREGFEIGRFVSIDKKINEFKYNYYDALKKASEGWHENKQDYTPFLIFMMQILYSCYKELDEHFYEASSKGVPKGKLVESILLNTVVPISKAEILSRVPEVSVSTVEKVINKLMREGRICKIGTYKNARYKKA